MLIRAFCLEKYLTDWRTKIFAPCSVVKQTATRSNSWADAFWAACQHMRTEMCLLGTGDLHRHSCLCSLSLLGPSRPEQLCSYVLVPQGEAAPLCNKDDSETLISKEANCMSISRLFSVSLPFDHLTQLCPGQH